MATIVLTSYMVRHPLGGVLASNLQLIWGLSRLGHEVYVFEPAGYPKSCFDPIRMESGDNCEYGVRTVRELFESMGYVDRLCFVDAEGGHHGLSRRELVDVFARCDLFIDRGDHRVWAEESSDVPVRVLIDPDPGYRQVKLFNEAARGEPLPQFDAYYTYGYNVASGASSAPTAGLEWRHMFHPIDTRRFQATPIPTDGAFTTVMNWTSHKAVEFAGTSYGMKDVEFEHFLELPRRTGAALEVAAEGKRVPHERLEQYGWRVRSAIEVTGTLDAYFDYIRRSAGEFSVVKSVYRGLNVGWFSDRSAAYMAMGRPVIIQDNGLTGVLPSGEGLFAVQTMEEAAAALDSVLSAPARHGAAARDIAIEYLDTVTVLSRFLRELGVE